MTPQNFHTKLLVLTAPSGAGKTTIVHHLLKTFPFLGFSVSATTRKKRGHEIDGKDYYFHSEKAFREKINAGQFAEFEEVYPGQYYGTLRSEIERLWTEGKVVVFDIDVKGGQPTQGNIRRGLFRDFCQTTQSSGPDRQAKATQDGV